MVWYHCPLIEGLELIPGPSPSCQIPNSPCSSPLYKMAQHNGMIIHLLIWRVSLWATETVPGCCFSGAWCLQKMWLIFAPCLGAKGTRTTPASEPPCHNQFWYFYHPNQKYHTHWQSLQFLPIIPPPDHICQP